MYRFFLEIQLITTLIQNSTTLMTFLPVINSALIPSFPYDRYDCIGHNDHHCQTPRMVSSRRFIEVHRSGYHHHGKKQDLSIRTKELSEHDTVKTPIKRIAHEINTHGKENRPVFRKMHEIRRRLRKTAKFVKIHEKRLKVVETVGRNVENGQNVKNFPIGTFMINTFFAKNNDEKEIESQAQEKPVLPGYLMYPVNSKMDHGFDNFYSWIM